MSSMAFSEGSFESCYSRLLELKLPLLLQAKPTDPSLTDTISSLYLHPALEAALHVLNNDLASAHFLVRHMETAPAHEAMYIHGILHRIEGDYDNARAWYNDVKCSNVFQANWETESHALNFISEIERLSKEGIRSQRSLEDRSIQEIKGVVQFCAQKFGTSKYQDAREAWVTSNGEKKKLGQEMVSGDKGIRKF
ncbi:hypothetical protein MMC10_006912 [Thelotrema lepadinum]|nr:hypothetical protein [Thelotrema lepadinum]